MKFNIKYKDIVHDTERDVFIFNTKHPVTGEDIHTEQPITSKTAFNTVKSAIDVHITEVDTLMNTVVEVDIATPFQVSVTKKRFAVGEQLYSEELTIE